MFAAHTKAAGAAGVNVEVKVVHQVCRQEVKHEIAILAGNDAIVNNLTRNLRRHEQTKDNASWQAQAQAQMQKKQPEVL